MTEILLFHSASGLTEGVTEFADALRAAGHTVHTPDFYDGRTFTDLDEGVAYRDLLGIPEIVGRAQAAAAELPEALVYAGFSLGAAPAQLLAQTRPGALGGLLMLGSLPSAAFESPWPEGLPLSIHGAEADPWRRPGPTPNSCSTPGRRISSSTARSPTTIPRSPSSSARA
jgi:dienelactone hydrolase